MPLPSSCASSVAAESEMGMVWSREGGSAPTRVTDQPTHSPAGALSNGPSAPATPVLSPGNYTTWRDAPFAPLQHLPQPAIAGGTTQSGEGAEEFILQVLVLNAVALLGLGGEGQRGPEEDSLSLPAGKGRLQGGRRLCGGCIKGTRKHKHWQMTSIFDDLAMRLPLSGRQGA